MNRLTGRSSYYSIIVMDSLILEGLGIDYFTVWILKIDSRYKFLNIKNKYCGVDTNWMAIAIQFCEYTTIFLIKTTLYEIATHTSVIAKTTHWVIGYPTLSYRFTTYSVKYP